MNAKNIVYPEVYNMLLSYKLHTCIHSSRHAVYVVECVVKIFLMYLFIFYYTKKPNSCFGAVAVFEDHRSRRASGFNFGRGLRDLNGNKERFRLYC